MRKYARLIDFDGCVDLVVEVEGGEEPDGARDEENAQRDQTHVPVKTSQDKTAVKEKKTVKLRQQTTRRIESMLRGRVV